MFMKVFRRGARLPELSASQRPPAIALSVIAMKAVVNGAQEREACLVAARILALRSLSNKPPASDKLEK